MNIEQKILQYREIRKQVWFEATRIPSSSLHEHASNQELFKSFITGLCNRCQLINHNGNDNQAALVLWHKMWTVIRYAGIRSNTATNEIKSIESIFDNYEEFVSADWDIEKHASTLLSGGSKVQDLKNRSGIFQGKKPIANWSKNKRTVGLARDLAEFMKTKSPSTSVIDFITGGNDINNVWAVLSHLQSINYQQRITALHLMMDLGFQVVKPDIVLSRIFLELGWTKEVIPSLPLTITTEDLNGKGNHGSTYNYTKPKMYRPVIDLAREIVSQINPEDLRSDIGWVTDNPIREFDFFMVKFGQEPEPSRGIVRKLFKPGIQTIKPTLPVRTKACRN
ncbi:hypothetical protein [Aliivibrio wodanis]|uniref:hypothetical protein n=1 Tax=Aliivibrio wodanis TaxID=80852 RepID=UPI00406D1177